MTRAIVGFSLIIGGITFAIVAGLTTPQMWNGQELTAIILCVAGIFVVGFKK